MAQTRTKISQAALIARAKEAMRRAHAPYSHFRVGAALLTKSGKVYTGCNIEISSYSLTLCAERTAIFKAVSEGARKFSAIAIISDSPSFISPCGACRQVISDLLGDVEVYMADARGRCVSLRSGELLPVPFDGAVLKKFSRK
jgi:cytidine deaminase